MQKPEEQFSFDFKGDETEQANLSKAEQAEQRAEEYISAIKENPELQEQLKQNTGFVIAQILKEISAPEDSGKEYLELIRIVLDKFDKENIEYNEKSQVVRASRTFKKEGIKKTGELKEVKSELIKRDSWGAGAGLSEYDL